MSRERIKSFVLAILVMINFVLGAKILNEKKLWPYGYDFFSFIENTDIYKAIKNRDKAVTKTHITMPQQIFVNTGEQTSRILLRPGDETFSKAYSVSAETLVSALRASKKNIRSATKEEFISALNGKSFYFCYATENDTRLFGEFFAADSSDLAESVASFSGIVITSERNVFFEDYKTGAFYLAKSGISSKEILNEINSIRSSSSGADIINYSAELKFDESFGTQTVTLSSSAPVYSTRTYLPSLKSVNPLLNSNGEPDSDIVQNILPLFRINSGNVRSYHEADGTLVFVENNGILKITPDGILSYQSTASGGFSISADNSYVDSVTALANFTDKVSAAAAAESDLYISCRLSEKNPYITFDCRAFGIPVSINIDGAKNAVEAEIKNGSLISYKQVLRRYSASVYDSAPLSPFISALDSAVEKYSQNMKNVEIQNIYPVYTDDGTREIYTADWFTEVKTIDLGEEELQ